MREIKGHIVNPNNDTLCLVTLDEKGAGNANHHYQVKHEDEVLVDINFQNGPINEHGVNGLTNEVLLEIVADRLRGFQDGEYRCKENACALTHIEEAQHWLQQRTIERMRRGVEGTYQK